jgi:glycosyltransferase involved in cell wall biosynthesis
MSKVLYVVNNDSATSIPLEVAGHINQQQTDFQTVVYYKESSGPQNEFIRDLINIGAKSSFDLKGWWEVFKLIKQNRPDVIHAHHTWSAFIFFLIAKFVSPSTKLIKTEHNNHRFFSWRQDFLNFFTLFFADIVLCNSESTKNSYSFLEKKIAQRKSKVCYNGVNLAMIKNIDSKVAQGSFKDEEVIIGSVGRLIEQKDYPTLIKAFSYLSNQLNKQLKLLIIGDGEDRNKLKSLVKKEGLTDMVLFTGVIDRKLVFSFLKDIDVFVMSSLWEGFCNTLVEAMAAEKAIVCSNIPTLVEVGGNAVLFAEPGNHESFSSKIKKLLIDKELKNKMKRKAAKRAEKFTLEACAKRYMSYYEIN